MFPLHIQVSLKAGTVLFVPCSDRDPGLMDLAEVSFLVLHILLLGFSGLEFSWSLILPFYLAIII